MGSVSHLTPEIPPEVQKFGDDLGPVEERLLDERQDSEKTCVCRLAFRVCFGFSFEAATSSDEHENALLRILTAYSLIGSVNLVDPASYRDLEEYVAALQLFQARNSREFDSDEHPEDLKALQALLEEIDETFLLKWRLIQRRNGREYDPAIDQTALEENYQLCLGLFKRTQDHSFTSTDADHAAVWQLVRTIQVLERLIGRRIKPRSRNDFGNLKQLLAEGLALALSDLKHKVC